MTPWSSPSRDRHCSHSIWRACYSMFRLQSISTVTAAYSSARQRAKTLKYPPSSHEYAPSVTSTVDYCNGCLGRTSILSCTGSLSLSTIRCGWAFTGNPSYFPTFDVMVATGHQVHSNVSAEIRHQMISESWQLITQNKSLACSITVTEQPNFKRRKLTQQPINDLTLRRHTCGSCSPSLVIHSKHARQQSDYTHNRASFLRSFPIHCLQATADLHPLSCRFNHRHSSQHGRWPRLLGGNYKETIESSINTLYERHFEQRNAHHLNSQMNIPKAVST